MVEPKGQISLSSWSNRGDAIVGASEMGVGTEGAEVTVSSGLKRSDVGLIGAGETVAGAISSLLQTMFTIFSFIVNKQLEGRLQQSLPFPTTGQYL